MNTATTINQLIQSGALFVVNHSGGKDSQAMLIKIRELVPADQILVIHAHLPGVEWDDTEAQVYRYAQDLDVITTQATKTFFDMVEHRGMWPSPQYRQCTSDLKRGPIEKVIRNYLKDRDNKQIVNCMGLRAEESSQRSKATVFKRNERNSKAGRDWYDWLPIHDMLIDEVFGTIAAAGQEPHWAYRAGMTRLSCCFCIMSSTQDIKTAARLNPKLYRKYSNMERKLNFTFLMPKKGQQVFLSDIVEGKTQAPADSYGQFDMFGECYA